MKIKTELNNLNNYQIYLKVEQAVNDYLQKKGYLKVDLPVLSPALVPESYLEVFKTEFNYFGKKGSLYLTPSPELFLKRLLSYGIGNCYFLGKSFRNSEPNSSWHLPEFTILEFYKIGVSYLEMAEEVLGMLRNIKYQISNIKNTYNKSKIKKQNTDIFYQGKKISLNRWEKISVTKAFEKYAKTTEKELFDHKRFFIKAKNKGYKVAGFTYEDIFSQIFVQEIEPYLGKNGFPTLIYDYPKELASLAEINKNGKTAQRCEFYIGGIEIGGFCTELNDYKEQEKRFIYESIKRKKSHLIDHSIDKGFIEALKYGLPRCTGAGIGFERLAMIFADVNLINKLKLINIE